MCPVRSVTYVSGRSITKSIIYEIEYGAISIEYNYKYAIDCNDKPLLRLGCKSSLTSTWPMSLLCRDGGRKNDLFTADIPESYEGGLRTSIRHHARPEALSRQQRASDRAPAWRRG
jgi:hypothetical protein